MTGERLLWYQVASRLGMPVQQAQARITSREFLEWRVYLEREQSQATVDHYYLAQIAAEVRRGWVRKPKSVKLQDFILKTEQQQAATTTSQQVRTEQSRAMWLAVCKVPPPAQE